jgi:hypothetical protein
MLGMQEPLQQVSLEVVGLLVLRQMQVVTWQEVDGESMKAGHHPVKCLRVSSVTKCHTCNWFRVIFIFASRNDTAGIDKIAL